MHLSKKTISIILMASASQSYANSDFYMGAEYAHESLRINKVDNMVAEDYDSPYLPPIQLIGTVNKSYQLGGIYIGYKFSPKLSIEMGYAQSKAEKKDFIDQSELTFDGTSKISTKTYRIELLGSHTFQNNSKLSLIGSIGAVYKEADIKVQYKEHLACTTQLGAICSPYSLTHKNDNSSSIRMQYGVGAQYQFNESISMRVMGRSVLNNFSFSSGTPYSLSVGAQYHF